MIVSYLHKYLMAHNWLNLNIKKESEIEKPAHNEQFSSVGVSAATVDL